MLLLTEDSQQFGEYCPQPTVGCGYELCFEEDEYIIDAGEKAALIIAIEDGAQINSDNIIIAGVSLSVDTSTNTNDNDPTTIINEVNNNNSLEWILAVWRSIQEISEFNNYDLSLDISNLCITICGKQNGFISQFENTNLSSSGFVRGSTIGKQESNGIEPTYKENYYVFLELIDNKTQKPVYKDNAPLNVWTNEDGELKTKIGFDLSSIANELPSIKTQKPDCDDELYFQDKNSVCYFSIRAYAKYKDSQNACGTKYTNTILVGDQANNTGFPFVRFIDRANENSFDVICDGPEPMTSTPEEYKYCRDSDIYFRFHRKVNQFLGNSYSLDLIGEMTYTDGTVDIIEENLISEITDESNCEIHVVRLCKIFENLPTKKFDKFTFKITYFEDPLNEGDATREITINFDNSSQGNCCKCHNEIKFESFAGNYDSIIARCDVDINLELSFSSLCISQDCEDYDGGRSAEYESKPELLKTNYIYADWKYIVEFLCSKNKVIKSNGKYINIIPTESSYQVYKNGQKGRLKFTYIEGPQKKTF